MSDNVLTLADGTRINTQTGRPIRDNGVPPGYTAVPTHDEARKSVTRVRKRLADLPDVPEKMNIIAVVASYYMFGLSDAEIAVALGCTEQQVGNIKTTDAFGQLVETLTSNIVEGQQDDVRTLLSQGSYSAAQALIEALNSENEQVQVVAAKDVLDRAGHRPADVVEHRHKVEGGLTIEYVKKGSNDTMPTINLTAMEVAEDGDDS